MLLFVKNLKMHKNHYVIMVFT